MPGKQAKVVTPQMLRRMLRRTSIAPFPARDRVMILLSIKAGLRACEMARLEWSMVLDARGKIADILAIHDAIAKKRGGRRIPMHPNLRHALRSLLRISEPFGPVIRSARGGHLRPTSVVNWFAALFSELGFEGCSSHSGRRTFITTAARNIHRSGCSLCDVQLLAHNAPRHRGRIEKRPLAWTPPSSHRRREMIQGEGERPCAMGPMRTEASAVLNDAGSRCSSLARRTDHQSQPKHRIARRARRQN
jgi:integrase